jgi:hypothetical protein
MESSLSWHVPQQGDPAVLRVRLAQVGLASVVAALVLLVASPPGWRALGLAGLLPLAGLMAWRHWQQHQQQLAGTPNLRLDALGLHWLDAAGMPHTIARHQIEAFRIGQEEHTLRPVPALTLHLAGGFESQPIELHPPATPHAVRTWLATQWGLPERPADTASLRAYDVACDVYSECHPETQQWHFEGTVAALREFFSHVARAARELPLPPEGARPQTRLILARRRAAARLRVGPATVPSLSEDAILAPPAVLQAMAAGAEQLLAEASPEESRQWEVSLAPHDVWTFHLHVCCDPRPGPEAAG